MTQAEALSILKTGGNVFLTGEPGSGKTHTVSAYVAWLRSHGIEPSITASTGIAATHIHGMTIHAWSGIGIAERLSAELLERVSQKEHVAKRIQKSSVLVIDEVSMLSADVLTMVDAVAKEVRRDDRPFGGMQVVLVGDFFQLPPVAKAGRETAFAFESPAWRALNPLVCYLTEQHRQEDASFLSLLGAIRAQEADHTHISLILSRETDAEGIEEGTPQLFTHNADVDRLNDEKLAALPGSKKTFAMARKGAPAVIEGLKRGCLSPETLALKEGAVVMFTKNNPIAGYANGTIGAVIGFERGTSYPEVETRDGRRLTVGPVEWAVEEGGKVRAQISQVPLRLAWAITVHKSQGQSLDAAAIDLSRAFEYGQGYVALSRVRTLSGLSLLGWSEHALAIHPEVARRDGEFRALSAQAANAFAALDADGTREEMERNFIRASGGTLETIAPSEGKKPKKSTYEETLELVRAGNSVADIALTRSLTLGTIADHLEKLNASGKLDAEELEPLFPAPLKKALPKIHEVFDKTGTEKLSPAFARLKGKHSYDELKLARILYRAG
ncbi:MAG TPA: helix-turn-helix domain-containing protein [Candidatus Paceibacterota bacterium]|nr:helix-turn-helix domain-containing protein [Candidatus Paceibacterota bacterium]